MRRALDQLNAAQVKRALSGCMERAKKNGEARQWGMRGAVYVAGTRAHASGHSRKNAPRGREADPQQLQQGEGCEGKKTRNRPREIQGKR